MKKDKDVVIIPIRMRKQLWEDFKKLNGRNSANIIRILMEGYLTYVITKKGDKKE